jgi:hypothetical protein
MINRNLNDIDFIVNSFDDIPVTLSRDFLFRHIHPSDPPGKTLLQCVDSKVALRIDVFRAFSGTMERTGVVEIVGAQPMRIIGLEDLAARYGRLALVDLTAGVTVPFKYLRDYFRVAEIADPAKLEIAWQDQRKATQPKDFREAHRELQSIAARSQESVDGPEYSRNPDTICDRCRETPTFKLANPRLILSVMGYC